MPRPAAPSSHLTLCDELTLNETVWPTEILVFDGENEKPLFETVAAGPEGAAVVVVGAPVVVVVVGLTVVAVIGATVVLAIGLAVVVVASTMRVIVFDDDLAG